MAEYQIPINVVVNVSAVTPSAGLEPLKISTIAIFTDEEPITPLNGNYMISRTGTSIVNAFGTNSETAAQANVIFSQQPNILANNGYVIVAPFQTIENPATAGTLTTPVLTANVEAFKEVTDGVLNLTIDNVEKEVENMNFSTVESVADIATILQEKFTDIIITANEDNEIVFKTNTIGATSSIEISPMSASTGTDLYDTEYLDGAFRVKVNGTDETTTSETLAEAISRLAGEIYFEGILTTRTVLDDEYTLAASIVEPLTNRIMMLPIADISGLNGIAKAVSSYVKTRPVLYLTGTDTENIQKNARLFAAAYLSRGLAVNYSGSNTTLTMNLKTLAGINADTQINETILEQAKAAGVDCYPSIEGLAKVQSFKHANQYFDQVTNVIWFVNAIQREVFNVLATTNTKIPQTDIGLESVRNAIRGVCRQGVINGYIAPGTWNSPDTFGDYEDFFRNIEEFGYYEYHPPVAEQTQSERELRQAPYWQIAAKEAGATHSTNILIYIEA